LEKLKKRFSYNCKSDGSAFEGSNPSPSTINKIKGLGQF